MRTDCSIREYRSDFNLLCWHNVSANNALNYASIFDGGLLAWVNCGSVATNLCSSQLTSEDDSDNLFACMMCHKWAKSLRYPYYPFAGYSAVNYG